MTPEEIKTILETSGYLFEQRVASLIEGLGFHTSTNKAFLDPDEGKSREIDVVANREIFRLVQGGNPDAFGVCYLNCECKNSTTPFVFITRRKGFMDKLYTPNGIILPYKEYYKNKDQFAVTALNAFYYLELEKYHYVTKSDVHAVQLCKIIQNRKKVEAQHSGVIEGFIYPLIKSQKIWETQTPKTTTEKIYCKLFFNIAVVNSKLYTIDADDENSLPIEAEYVPFVRDIHTKDHQGRFIITFVTYSALGKFIETEVGDFCKKVEETFMKRPELLYNRHVL